MLKHIPPPALSGSGLRVEGYAPSSQPGLPGSPLCLSICRQYSLHNRKSQEKWNFVGRIEGRRLILI